MKRTTTKQTTLPRPRPIAPVYRPNLSEPAKFDLLFAVARAFNTCELMARRFNVTN
jgi:hypothetical protein